MLGRLATGTLQHKQDRMRAIRRPKHPAIEKKEKKKWYGREKVILENSRPSNSEGFESFYT